MKKFISLFVLAALLVVPASMFAGQTNTWIRVNQAGYLPGDIKVAVMLSLTYPDKSFEVVDALSDKVVFKGVGVERNGEVWGMKSGYRLDFSEVNVPGGYYICAGGVKSPTFRIGDDVYAGLPDFMLEYMRQQRCGDNPYTGEKCHQHDGYIVDHPTKSNQKIDVTGGWHDATDYLQYQTTSATALYHLMLAYTQYKDKGVFKDNYRADGRRGSNGIPDILDEIRWGMDWLVKMNPEDEVMFSQIADDRDHAGFRLPQDDKVDYGWGPGTGRPVYFVTGKPQGLGKYINRTTGVASVAGKFASCFALGSEIFLESDPSYSSLLKKKGIEAYRFAEKYPGNTQTACLKSPYFYEEDTYTDDIELAAATFYTLTGDADWRKKADYWGELEPISPWMELGRGRHYQFYPFINIGHFLLAQSSDSSTAYKYRDFMKMGLESLLNRAADDPFIYGVPFLWCSNNLVSAAITHALLYRNATGDNRFFEMECALRDWLFGCNPWGTSMIVGYPAHGDYPDSPHSSYTQHNGDLTYGGLVDGPVYKEIFLTRAGKSLRGPDKYATFNNGKAVYHDDIGDYASNEPTMDGTAGLCLYFAHLESSAKEKNIREVRDAQGAVVRIDKESKEIYLMFSADSMFDGGKKIIDVLNKNRIKGSFFFTGNFLRLKEREGIIKKIIADGHYVGAHSDKHLLYAPWGKRDQLLISIDSVLKDIAANYDELAKFGIKSGDARWFLPPFEWYNKATVAATATMGLTTINYTPGTATPADYTTPDMKSYKSSEELINRLYKFEKESGLNGALILIHPGTENSRTDKLYNQLDKIVKYLKKKGYKFERLK